jgi:hypothetical protein
MPIPVSVQDVAGELGLGSDEVSSYLNRKTGEFFSWNEDWGSVPEDEDEDEDLSSYPEWQREEIVRYREVCNSDDWLPLPSAFDVHEWEIMSRFCETVESQPRREALRDAIHRRRAFRRFKDEATRLGLIEKWYEYRDDALRALAVE